MENLLLPIGNTPVVKIKYMYKNKINYFYSKLEYYNLTGSIKDRAAYFILKKAIENGALKPNQPIAEASSGNFGISVAAIGAMLKREVHIFMPSFVTEERKELLKLYGATLHLNNDEHDAFNIAIANCENFARQHNAFETSQFQNFDNVNAHYYGTGTEIVDKLGSLIGGFVAGIGSGGTFTGIAKKIKDYDNSKITYCIEPNNMPIFSGGELTGHSKISGIADDFIPNIVDTSLIDGVIGVEDDDAINMSRKLSKELGLGVGISSGAYAIGAILLNEKLKKPCVTVFSDDNKKYLSTELADNTICYNNPDFISNQIKFLGLEIC